MSTPKKAPIFKTEWNYDTNIEGDESGLKCTDKSLTIQSMKDEADINTIVKRFGLDKNPHFGNIPIPPGIEEFSEIFDFQTAMNTVRQAQESFAMLHPQVRKRFNNDPGEFVGTIDNILSETDPKRRERGLEELREMGLVNAAPTPESDDRATPPTPPQGGGT